jgi:branched-chain amino acid transport system substrate-binding protein
MKRFIFVPLAILLILGLIFTSCSSPTPSPAPAAPPTKAPITTAAPPTTSGATSLTPTSAAKPPIKIGALLHLTGENAVTGTWVKNALEYRIEQLGGQIAGRKIELIIEDDATNPVTGVEKAKKLVIQDMVEVVIGPIHGGVSAAVANYMATTKIPQLIILGKQGALLKLGGGNIFLPLGTLESYGSTLGSYAYDTLGYKTITSIFEDFATGQTMTNGFVKTFEKKGGTITQSQPVKPGTMDFAPYLTAVKQSDAVLFWFTPVLAQRFVTQYYASGLKMPLVIPNCTVLFPKSLGEIGDKTIGIIGSTNYTSLIDTPINKTYVENFVKKYGYPPQAEGVGADVNLILYSEAVKSTGGDSSPAKIIEALKKVKVETPDGTFSFTPENLGIGDFYITKVVKLPERYDWSVLYKYSQITLDVMN